MHHMVDLLSWSTVTKNRCAADTIDKRVSTVGRIHPHLQARVVEPGTSQVSAAVAAPKISRLGSILLCPPLLPSHLVLCSHYPLWEPGTHKGALHVSRPPICAHVWNRACGHGSTKAIIGSRCAAASLSEVGCHHQEPVCSCT